MTKRPIIPVAARLRRIVVGTLSLAAGAGGQALVACDTSSDLADGSRDDALQPDTLQADTQPQDATVDAGDAPQTDERREDSTVDAGDVSEALICDVGFLSCCFEACSCSVPVTPPWIPCGIDAEAGACPSAQPPLGCSQEELQQFCSASAYSCYIFAVEAGAAQVECRTGGEACGRRPRGFAPSRVLGNDPAGVYLARCAQLEAASIDAFEILREELEGFGAPGRLVVAARRAARDEIRHAATMAALAGSRATIIERAKAKRGARRSLQAVAIENAVEGCVRETYGALVAMWQAQTAADVGVRHAMRGIGADEAKHAQLAWDVHRWMDTRLSPSSRRTVERAKQEALVALRAELRQSPLPRVARSLGLPSKSQAMLLLNQLTKEVTDWKEPRARRSPRRSPRRRYRELVG